MIYSILIGLVIGLLGGWFMGVSFGGSTIIGFIVCAVVGLVGSSIGGMLSGIFKVKNPVLKFILDVVGACILIAIVKFVTRLI